MLSIREPFFCPTNNSTLWVHKCCTLVLFKKMRGSAVTGEHHLTLRPIIHSNINCELMEHSFNCLREVGWVGVTFPPPLPLPLLPKDTVSSSDRRSLCACLRHVGRKAVMALTLHFSFFVQLFLPRLVYF